MDIVKRMDKIIEIKKELLKELKALYDENGIYTCEFAEIHLYRGIELIEKAYGVKADFDVRISSYGKLAYKSIEMDGLEIFQTSNMMIESDKNSGKLTEDDFEFLKAEVRDEDNE